MTQLKRTIDEDLKTITILVPQPTQHVYRGWRNNRPAEAKPMSTRWTEEDRKFIDGVASKLGLSFSEFVRWCSFHCAIEVNKVDHIKSFKLAMPQQYVEAKPDYEDYV